VGQFVYKAVNRSGEHVAGTIEAPDHRSAVAGLAEKGHFVVELAEETAAAAAAGAEAKVSGLTGLLRFGRGRMTGKDILAVTSQLSTALHAGLPLLNALEIIRDQQHKTGMRELLNELAHSVSSGQSLSEAMSSHERIFSPLHVSMVRVGETGGILEQTTGQLTQIVGRDEKIKTSMKNAAAYPIFVLGLGLASAVIVLTWILPKVLRTIAGGVKALPLPTRILMSLSGFFTGVFTTFVGWIGIIAIGAGIYYLVKWTKGTGKIRWDGFRLKIPLVGSVLKTIAVGRFARTLGALTKGGVTILEALGVVRDTLGNEVLAREIDEVAEKVKAGASLAGPLDSSGLFPPLLVQIVAVGEQTGKLDELLLNAAETFDADADAAIARFMAIFPAVLILLVAVMIGFIIAATLLPIVMMELGGGIF
jgi:type II secretory pathway component PulF